jgi:hypothetical protein
MQAGDKSFWLRLLLNNSQFTLHIIKTKSKLWRLIFLCTSPPPAGYVAFLNKQTTSSHQRSSLLRSPLNTQVIAISAPPHASFIRISEHTSTTAMSKKEKKEVRNLMQDIRKVPNALILLLKDFWSMSIFYPSNMRRRSESQAI